MLIFIQMIKNSFFSIFCTSVINPKLYEIRVFGIDNIVKPIVFQIFPKVVKMSSCLLLSFSLALS